MLINMVKKVGARIPMGILPKGVDNLFLPFYHSVGASADLPHIRHLYSPRDERTFIRDLEYILKYFQPIGLCEVMALARGGGGPAKPSFHLSFDDGLSEVFHVAMPILERLGVPATLFLNRDFIGNRDLFFRYKASLLIGHLPSGHTGISKRGILQNNRPDSPLWSTWAERLGVDYIHFLTRRRPYMGERQIREWLSKGFTIGGHSCNHPYYHTLPENGQIIQTKESVDALVARFGIDYRAFAFPFFDHGVAPSFFRHFREDGSLDVTFGTSGVKRSAIPHHFHRLGMERPGTGEAIVKGALFYGGLRGMLR